MKKISIIISILYMIAAVFLTVNILSIFNVIEEQRIITLIGYLSLLVASMMSLFIAIRDKRLEKKAKEV